MCERQCDLRIKSEKVLTLYVVQLINRSMDSRKRDEKTVQKTGTITRTTFRKFGSKEPGKKLMRKMATDCQLPIIFYRGFRGLLINKSPKSHRPDPPHSSVGQFRHFFHIDQSTSTRKKQQLG